MKLFHYRSTPWLLGFWLLALAFLRHEVVSQSFLAKDARIDIQDGALIMRQDYLGYYLGGKKSGFFEFILKEDNADSLTKLPGKYYIFHANTLMQVELLGMTIPMKINVTGEVNEDLSMRSFRYSYDSSGQQLYVMGTMEKDGLHLTKKSEGSTNQQTIALHPPIYQLEISHLLMARDNLEIGNKKVFPIYDPLTMSHGNLTVTVEAKEPLELPDGKSVEAYKLSSSLFGVVNTSWISKDGDLLKEVSQMGGVNITSIRETKEQAMDMKFIAKGMETAKEEKSPQLTDLIDASHVKTDKTLTNLAEIQELRLKISGAEKADLFFEEPYQTLEKSEADGLIVRLRKPDYQAVLASLKSEKPPYQNSNAQNAKYLESDLYIQSSDAKIRNKALEITRNAETVWEASTAIAKWLYANIKKEMRATIPDSLEVLNSLKGDCNEHSTLFAALARSIGIPAKICAGLVYQNDGFYYHAWNEVLVDGHWLPTDSTLNQIEANATHLKLSEGGLDAQLSIIKLMGNIKIEILSSQEK